jgi:hypothetical protein
MSLVPVRGEPGRFYFDGLDPSRHPTLSRLLDVGYVAIEKHSYVGRAADGVLVAVGTVGDEDATERYLKAYPTPSLWGLSRTHFSGYRGVFRRR